MQKREREREENEISKKEEFRGGINLGLRGLFDGSQDDEEVIRRSKNKKDTRVNRDGFDNNSQKTRILTTGIKYQDVQIF